jgi:hypothetical protein
MRLRDTRRFVKSRLENLQSMFSEEPRLARAAIAQHVQRITLNPKGRSYIASGVWDWLDGAAVRMVPGARFAPRVPWSLAYHSLPDGFFGVTNYLTGGSELLHKPEARAEKCALSLSRPI